MGIVETAGLEKGTAFRPADLAGIRLLTYRLLASVFLYPSDERISSWRGLAGELLEQEQIWAHFGFHTPWRRLLVSLCETANQAAGLEGEYIRLFQVHASAPPYESYYLDPQHTVGGEISAQVAGEYAAAGLTVSASGRELPDLLASELEFMAYLCGREARAWASRRQGGAAAQMYRQQEFLARHLCCWLPLCAAKVERNAGGSLYAQAAGAAVNFIRQDQSLLRILIRELESALTR